MQFHNLCVLSMWCVYFPLRWFNYGWIEIKSPSNWHRASRRNMTIFDIGNLYAKMITEDDEAERRWPWTVSNFPFSSCHLKLLSLKERTQTRTKMKRRTRIRNENGKRKNEGDRTLVCVCVRYGEKEKQRWNFHKLKQWKTVRIFERLLQRHKAFTPTVIRMYLVRNTCTVCSCSSLAVVAYLLRSKE